jgi:hypothetical protein
MIKIIFIIVIFEKENVRERRQKKDVSLNFHRFLANISAKIKL